MHPYIIADIPGVELENNYKKIFGHVLQLEEEPVKDMAQHAAAVKKNFDPGKKVHTTHDQIKVVDEVIESNSDSDSESDYDEDDYTPRMINREDSDSSNNGSEVDPDESQDDVLVVDVNEIKEEKYPRLCRGHVVQNQTTYDYVP